MRAVRRSERIVDSAEHRAPSLAEAKVDVADDLRARDTAHAKTHGPMEVRHRARAGSREDPAGVDKGPDLETHVGAERGETRDAHAQLPAGRKQVGVEVAARP